MGVYVCSLCIEPWGDSHLRTIYLFATILLSLLMQAWLAIRVRLSRGVSFGQQLQKPALDVYINSFQEDTSEWELGRERMQRWCPLAFLVSGEDYNLSLDVC